jgi:protein-S-isoprenylcysteine O-methyltransferase Ste14
MSAVASSMRRPAATHVATSVPVALLFVLFGISNFAQWRATHRPIGLGATALELLVATLFVVRRSPWLVSKSPLAWTAAAAGTFGMLTARPAYAPLGGLEPLYVVLQLAGALFAGAGLFSLGRSFGLVAANRGIRTRGPYRLVRHPVYTGYVITWTAYLFENPSLWNACILSAVTAIQGVRIREEERTLANDPAYQAYCRRVRSRVLPLSCLGLRPWRGL